MKSITKQLGALIGALLISGPALAVPALQVDISGGTYEGGSEESVVTSADQFALWAIGTPKKNTLSEADLLSTTFYLVIALIPKTSDGFDFGSFSVNGTSYSAADMAWGTPPEDSVDSNHELAGHGIYDTQYLEVAFQFQPFAQVAKYNVQDNPGGPTAGSGAFGMAWSIDVSGLNAGMDLHFDLYSVMARKQDANDLDADIFAPFSHDGRTRRSHDVPAPGTLVLLGLGLLGFGFASRRNARA